MLIDGLLGAVYDGRAECQQLQEQVLQLKQQNEELRANEAEGWFASARSGLAERQRMIEAVYRAKCSWDDVGAAVLEVLNNDLIWDAVERSARRGKERASRGLGALLTQLDALDDENEAEQSRRTSMEDAAGERSQLRSVFAHSRRSPNDPVRLIQCRACNGAGFIDPSASEDGDPTESDSYLRKTLAQVLELKAALASAGDRSETLERQLQTTVSESMAMKKQLEEIEFVRRHGVDRYIQADMDDEDDVDLDEILRASMGEWGSQASGAKKRFLSNRSAQYEHLIVELKSALDEKIEAIDELRRAHSDAQDRLRSSQLASQREQEAHLQEVTTLKTSLTLALKQQNSAIEEKQEEVALMLQKLGTQRSTMQSLGAIHNSVNDDASDDGEGPDADDDVEQEDLLALDALSEEELAKLDEVKRSEAVARRYSQAILRVQTEYEAQKSLLQQSEEEINHEDERRQRTNSITLGNIVVSVASHPRELFKALSTTRSELLNVRRASQRASTLQTDRLLTLTTHLGHLSEELCMVRKRTKAEIEFWKLECEMTQNSSKALTADLQKAQLQLQAASERRVSVVATGDKCALCEKHEARLMEISSALLLRETQQSLQAAAEDTDVSVGAIQLTQQERQHLSQMVLEIESLCATMTASKQENARELVAAALLGDEFAAKGDVRASGSGGGRCATRTELSRSSPSSSPRSFRQQDNDPARRKSRTYSRGRAEDPASEPHESDRNKRMSVSANAFGSDSDVLASSDRALLLTPTVFGEANLLISGRSLSSSSGGGMGVAMFAPSHHKKKVVRKILSEDEAMRRRFTSARQRAAEPDNNASIRSDEHPSQVAPTTPDDSASDADGSGVPECSSYLDENGLEVFYEDVEVEAEDEGGDEDGGEAFENQASERRVEHSDVSDVPCRIEQPHCVRDEQAPAHQSPRQAEPTSHSRAPRELTLLDDQNNIESDPQVITQLRDLVKQHTTVKETLALMNWRVLICHLRSLREQTRLEWVRVVGCELSAAM